MEFGRRCACCILSTDARGVVHGDGLRVLPRVTMGASNEQFLFEVNVRLQYSEDPAVLTGALRELQEAVVEDFPAEVGDASWDDVISTILERHCTTDQMSR